MPGEGVCFRKHADILRYEEILRLVKIMAPLGVKKVRLTGGEPTVRRDLKDFITALSGVSGIEEIAMTTNGLLISGQAAEYRKAGLDAINISLDSPDEEVYSRITGQKGAGRVLALVDEALQAGLKVKLNCVPVKGINEEGLEEIALLAKGRALDVRFIELMPLGCGADHEGIGSDELLSRFEKSFGSYEPVSDSVKTAGPAQCFSFEGFKGRIGFISPISHRFCESCNRLRLTSEGYLKPCLFYEPEISLRDMMRQGATDDELCVAILDICGKKPEGHHFNEEDRNKEKRRMNEIGG